MTTEVGDTGILDALKQHEQPAARITEIRDQVRDPGRVSLFIDGEFRIGLDRRIVEERGLAVGKILTPDDLTTLETLEQVSRAFDRALRLLSFRPRSKSEVEIRLRRAGFDSAVIDKAMERLVESGYLDDREFARNWVETRLEHRPRGKRLLAAELRSKGVSRQVVDDALEGTDIDEREHAMQLARVRVARLGGLDADTRRRRLIGYLQRRGFGWDAVQHALRVLDESEAGGDDE
jgi:regulatory protein